MRTCQLRVQASLLLTPPPGLIGLRRHLDPRRAASLPPHVTLVYDDEAPDAALLLDRLRDTCGELPPLSLQLGSVEAFAPPDEGLYCATEAGLSFATLRARVLRPPFAPRAAVRPHVTLLHPGSVAAAPVDWRSHVGSSIQSATTVQEVTVIRSDGGHGASWP